MCCPCRAQFNFHLVFSEHFLAGSLDDPSEDPSQDPSAKARTTSRDREHHEYVAWVFARAWKRAL